jgi:hypothetical protein
LTPAKSVPTQPSQPLRGGSGRVLGNLARIRTHLEPYKSISSDIRDLDERLRTAAPGRFTVAPAA